MQESSTYLSRGEYRACINVIEQDESYVPHETLI